ncbi:MAG: universal stress protein [Dehalococcoidia bacterium]
MFSSILVPCDISYNDNHWLRSTIAVARDITEKHEARLHFITVVPDNLLKGFFPNMYEEELVEKARDRLEAIVSENLPGSVEREVHVRTGGICSEIIRAARDIPADLIVLASHGPILADYLLGSNASHVSLHAPCSVFIVRAKPEAPTDG